MSTNRGALETLNGENAKASATKQREITSLNIIEVDLRTVTIMLTLEE
jgi:hypothetical protein